MDDAKAGDSDAFARLYDAYVGVVYRYVLLRVSDEITTEDLVSQVFLKAWKNLGSYKTGSSPFIAWLFTIARNLVVDHYRSQKNLVPLDDVTGLHSDLETPDEHVQYNFDVQAVREAIQYLSADQQQALLLKYMAELPNENIAQIMNKKEGTVRGLQMRALQKLARYLQGKDLL